MDQMISKCLQYKNFSLLYNQKSIDEMIVKKLRHRYLLTKMKEEY